MSAPTLLCSQIWPKSPIRPSEMSIQLFAIFLSSCPKDKFTLGFKYFFLYLFSFAERLFFFDLTISSPNLERPKNPLT